MATHDYLTALARRTASEALRGAVTEIITMCATEYPKGAATVDDVVRACLKAMRAEVERHEPDYGVTDDATLYLH